MASGRYQGDRRGDMLRDKSTHGNGHGNGKHPGHLRRIVKCTRILERVRVLSCGRFAFWVGRDGTLASGGTHHNKNTHTANRKNSQAEPCRDLQSFFGLFYGCVLRLNKFSIARCLKLKKLTGVLRVA